MARYNEQSLNALFQANMKRAKTSLARLTFCCSPDPSFQGLTGWVFEQTVQKCLREELKSLGIMCEIHEQISLGGRTKADIVFGNIAMEIKAGGLFDGTAADRYRRYRAAAKKLGYTYLYVTLQEAYQPYRKLMNQSVGRQNAYFLDTHGDWKRLVERTAAVLARQKVK